ncbi:hypothetical protein JGUZn3_05100 [Entomobacter blattae]|uniref:Uncharacterized protein n=1 Tax=Entomobacter blattae TaxID=2762277 RepID=A0A7H1NPP8_9PROT|nr:hypothetical protein JGUZn3_05100 [Entomobacter blattae]
MSDRWRNGGCCVVVKSYGLAVLDRSAKYSRLLLERVIGFLSDGSSKGRVVRCAGPIMDTDIFFPVIIDLPVIGYSANNGATLTKGASKAGAITAGNIMFV